MPHKDFTAKHLADGAPVEVTAHWGDSSVSNAQPIALAFHGGGFVVGSRSMIPRQQISDLVETGFVVVTADYSLCPQVSLYDGPQQDAKDVYRWCKRDLPSLLAEEGVNVDPTRVVAMGHSAGGTLALCLGAEADPPSAILDFYGAKFLRDSFWASPSPALTQIPDFDEAFLNKVFSEPTLTFTPSLFERSASTTDTAPSGQSKTGMKKPDMSAPRNAWLSTCMKNGTHLKTIVQDGDFDRVDPANAFSANFPPTFFVHGAADGLVPTRFSVEAHRMLKGLGVDTGIALVPDASHGFDGALSAEDPEYAFVKEGLEFLKSRVNKH